MKDHTRAGCSSKTTLMGRIQAGTAVEGLQSGGRYQVEEVYEELSPLGGSHAGAV